MSINNLCKTFKGKYLCDINNIHIEYYKKNRLADGVAHATINRELACLRSIFNKAIEWKVLTQNPPKILLYKENNQRVRYLTEEEATLLINLAPEPLKSIIVVALNTGMRRGEILNLKWEDIDIREKVLTLQETKGGGKRHIPANNTVREIFSRIKSGASHEHVFTNRQGGALTYDYIAHHFTKIGKRAGIENFRFRDLRHMFASWLWRGLI